jgi:hypothetical protein
MGKICELYYSSSKEAGILSLSLLSACWKEKEAALTLVWIVKTRNLDIMMLCRCYVIANVADAVSDASKYAAVFYCQDHKYYKVVKF